MHTKWVWQANIGRRRLGRRFSDKDETGSIADEADERQLQKQSRLCDVSHTIYRPTHRPTDQRQWRN